MINGQPVLDLLESVVIFENPCNLLLLLGLTPKPTDNGVGLTNYAPMSLPQRNGIDQSEDQD